MMKKAFVSCMALVAILFSVTYAFAAPIAYVKVFPEGKGLEEFLMEGHGKYNDVFTDEILGDEDALDVILIKLAEPIHQDTEIRVYKNIAGLADFGTVFPVEGAKMVYYLEGLTGDLMGVETRLSEGIPNILIEVGIGGDAYIWAPRYNGMTGGYEYDENFPEWKD